MPLSGVHICWGFVSAAGGPVSLLGNETSSELMASPTTSSTSAPNNSGSQPVLSVSASAPIYYAVDAAPDASKTVGSGSSARRYYDPAFGREDIFVNAGDKFAWVLA
jgi:hypothetical protein